MHMLRPALTVAVLALCLTGCKRDQPSPQPTPPGPPRTPIAVDDRIVSANTTFAFNLFDGLIGDEPTENVFVSPSSVAIALAMAYNGASGETRGAMSQALALSDLTVDEVNQANADLLASLEQAEPAVTLSIANSLWAREGTEFAPAFIAANEAFYQAEVAALDFTAPSAVDTINAWVCDKTRGKILQIVQPPINQLAILFLINATYFKGQWVDKFDEGQTEDGPFTLLDGSEKTLPMMHQDGDYHYHRGEGFQAICLPYVGDRMSMYIVLPDEGSSLAAFCETLDPERWDALLQQLSEQEGTIVLPRFTVEYNVLLNDALTALGMGLAFDPGSADFTEMSDMDQAIWIQTVKHKTFVEVNEEGTEAAAVTSVEFAAEEAMPDEPFNMVVDRPFFCAIRDNQSGTLLFMGAITDPE